MMPTILHDKNHKARITHQCDSCQRTIERGQIYRKLVQKDGSDFWTWKQHLHCYEIEYTVWRACRLHYDEWPTLHEMDDEDVVLMIGENRDTAILGFGEERIAEVESKLARNAL